MSSPAHVGARDGARPVRKNPAIPAVGDRLEKRPGIAAPRSARGAREAGIAGDGER